MLQTVGYNTQKYFLVALFTGICDLQRVKNCKKCLFHPLVLCMLPLPDILHYQDSRRDYPLSLKGFPLSQMCNQVHGNTSNSTFWHSETGMVEKQDISLFGTCHILLDQGGNWSNIAIPSSLSAFSQIALSQSFGSTQQSIGSRTSIFPPECSCSVHWGTLIFDLQHCLFLSTGWGNFIGHIPITVGSKIWF